MVHVLRHYNKRGIPAEAMQVVRDELLKDGGLDYEDCASNYKFVYAMAR